MTDSGRFSIIPEPIPDHAYVYVIAASGEGYSSPVKVGYSQDPLKRVRSLATACPFPIECFFVVLLPAPLAKYIETSFHEVKSEARLHNEWFDLSPTVAAQLICLNISAAMHVAGCPTEGILQRVEETIWCADEQLELLGIPERYHG